MSKLYPVTIVTDRYSGSYAGAPWLAFYCEADEVPIEAYCGGDNDSMDWWANPTMPVGKGDTPDAALRDLEAAVAKERKDAPGKPPF